MTERKNIAITPNVVIYLKHKSLYFLNHISTKEITPELLKYK